MRVIATRPTNPELTWTCRHPPESEPRGERDAMGALQSWRLVRINGRT